MWQQLFEKIDTTLAGVTLVKKIFTTPQAKIDKYPAVFYKPVDFQNNFDTTTDNAQTFRFTMDVIVGSNGTTVDNAFRVVLPKVVDAIVDAFDSAWNGGTIDGHRVRVKIDSAGEWGVTDDKDGAEAVAPLSVEIKLLKSV